jgi:hypothetical protein
MEGAAKFFDEPVVREADNNAVIHPIKQRNARKIIII